MRDLSLYAHPEVAISTITNTVSATASNSTRDISDKTANFTAGSKVRLILSKIVGDGSSGQIYDDGEEVEYTITIKHDTDTSGNEVAANTITVTDAVPIEIKGVSATATSSNISVTIPQSTDGSEDTCIYKTGDDTIGWTVHLKLATLAVDETVTIIISGILSL